MRVLISFILLFTVSCTHTIHNHGVPGINIELWSKIQVGDDREKVVHTLGSPTLVSKFDENVWYYVSYKIKQANFLGKGSTVVSLCKFRLIRMTKLQI